MEGGLEHNEVALADGSAYLYANLDDAIHRAQLALSYGNVGHKARLDNKGTE